MTRISTVLPDTHLRLPEPMEQEQKNIKMLLLLYVGTKYLQTEKYFLQMVQYENMALFLCIHQFCFHIAGSSHILLVSVSRLPDNNLIIVFLPCKPAA